jgi:hypothetical protein
LAIFNTIRIGFEPRRMMATTEVARRVTLRDTFPPHCGQVRVGLRHNQRSLAGPAEKMQAKEHASTVYRKMELSYARKYGFKYSIVG